MFQKEYIKKKLSSKSMKERFISSGISHVSLFGSYARDEATTESDLDLLIELSPNNQVTLGTLQYLENILVEEFGVKRVDFLTKRKLSPGLKLYIEKDLLTIF